MLRSLADNDVWVVMGDEGVIVNYYEITIMHRCVCVELDKSRCVLIEGHCIVINLVGDNIGGAFRPGACKFGDGSGVIWNGTEQKITNYVNINSG